MIYFDNAATTAIKPPTVREAICRALDEYGGNPGRSSHALSLAAAECIDEARQALAALFGVEGQGEHIVFTMNATHALNLAIRTRVRRGSHLLISDREHNAVYRTVCRLAREGVAEFDVFSTRGDVSGNIRALLRENTDMLVCNHISNVDGAVAPVEEIGALCREVGLYYIVDASQSAGHRPLSFKSLSADAVCAPGHKGLFGPPGVGFVYLRDGRGLSPFLDGGSGSASLSPEMPTDLPERMEAGTLPTPAVAGLLAGVHFVREVGEGHIHARETALLLRLVDRLAGIRGLQLYTAGEGGVLSLTTPRYHPDELTSLCDRADICVRGGLHCAPLAHAALGTQRAGTVRVSLSYYNTEKEIDDFAACLRRFLDE